MDSFSVSVIVPTFNRSHLLPRALKSIFSQTVGLKEIIVVDDNVDLNQKSNVRLISEKFGNKVRVLETTGKEGGAAARNLGVLAATSDWIAFLDDDDEWACDKVEQQSKDLIANKVIGGFCGYTEVDEIFGDKVHVIPRSTKLTKDDLLSGGCPTSTSLCIIKKEVFVQAGMFDTSLKSYEDYDLWLRCAEYGDYSVSKNCLVNYYQHQGSRLSVDFEMRHAGLKIFMEKWSSILDENKFGDFYLNNLHTMYLANSKACLGVKYFSAIIWAVKGFFVKPKSLRGILWLVIALLGVRIGGSLRVLFRRRNREVFLG